MKNNINNINNFFVICIVGQPGSGKDTLANFLSEKMGFWHVSTGNIIREEMRARNIPTDRESMRFFSQDMRKKMGNSYPANIAASKIACNTVISGTRNMAEVEFFKNKFGKNFILVAVNAPMEVRYERIKNGRGRTGDNISFEKFKKQEEAECSSGTHELSKLLSMADYAVDNSQTLNKALYEMNTILERKVFIASK